MNTRIQFIGILIMVIFIAGCSGGSGPGIAIFDPYHGSEGLKMTFLKNTPRDEEYDKSNMRVGVMIENKGASSIKNGILVLGIDYPYMDAFSTKKIIFDLKGRNETRGMNGEKAINVFKGTIGALSDFQEMHESTVAVKACYQYLTLAHTDICIDTDFYDQESSRKACTAKDISLSDQGAPVAVTKIENEIMPENDNQVIVSLKIYFKNLGSGKVVKTESYEKFCDSTQTLLEEDFGQMKVTAILGGQPLTCFGNTDLASKTEHYITCTSQLIDVIPSYKTTLIVKLEYGYVFVEKKDFSIVQLLY